MTPGKSTDHLNQILRIFLYTNKIFINFNLSLCFFTILHSEFGETSTAKMLIVVHIFKDHRSNHSSVKERIPNNPFKRLFPFT